MMHTATSSILEEVFLSAPASCFLHDHLAIIFNLKKELGQQINTRSVRGETSDAHTVCCPLIKTEICYFKLFFHVASW